MAASIEPPDLILPPLIDARRRTPFDLIRQFLRALAWPLRRSIPLFRLFEVPVRLHLTYLLYPTGFLIWYGWSERMLGLVALLYPIICISLLAHEYAHVLTARRLGVGTTAVYFIPFGIVANLECSPPPRKDLWIALAGPLMSLLIAGLCRGGYWTIAGHLQWHSVPEHGWTHWALVLGRAVCHNGFYFNLFIAAFNLLPCFPMDGGRILRAMIAWFLQKRRGSQPDLVTVQATRIAVRYVALPIVIAIVTATVWKTHLWIHLVMFPLMIVTGEMEYRLVRRNALAREWMV
jgi:Zn-dependent protease